MTYFVFLPIFGLLSALILLQAIAIGKLQRRVDDLEIRLNGNSKKK